MSAAIQDMEEIASYISHELHSPLAAEKLSEQMINAADRLAMFPYINAAYKPKKPLMHEFRRLNVQNYTMFYVVDEDNKNVIIARVIYTRRDYDKLLRGMSDAD